MKIKDLSYTVFVKRGQLFRQGTVFAGYNDFTAHLTEMGSVSPDKSPHEWGICQELIISARLLSV